MFHPFLLSARMLLLLSTRSSTSRVVDRKMREIGELKEHLDKAMRDVPSFISYAIFL